MIKTIISKLKQMFHIVPIVGSLHLCTMLDCAEALKEICISLIISMSPVYIGGIGLYIMHGGTSTYMECVNLIVQNGELFIYAAAVLAPVVYIVSRDRNDVRSFPSKFTFIGTTIVVSLVSTCIFTIERVKLHILPNNIILISWIVFAVAVAVFYFALVYNNTLLPNPAGLMRENDLDFTRRYKNHRQETEEAS